MWERKYIKVRIGSNKKETIKILKLGKIDSDYIDTLTRDGYGGYEDIKNLEYIYIGYEENTNVNNKIKKNGFGYSTDAEYWLERNFIFCGTIGIKENRKLKLERINNVNQE